MCVSERKWWHWEPWMLKLMSLEEAMRGTECKKEREEAIKSTLNVRAVRRPVLAEGATRRLLGCVVRRVASFLENIVIAIVIGAGGRAAGLCCVAFDGCSPTRGGRQRSAGRCGAGCVVDCGSALLCGPLPNYVLERLHEKTRSKFDAPLETLM